ncbi:ATP-dependent DNA helicase PIF7-like [Thrips palmi]|uniref:ATP-dependent DNA helicase PIF7-like n=1 Tax=Thrips palmi TaxID=161013 RepID=A0A6P8ZZR9_THRPL|nr:ATP-dependent DNA helicase PIF7-like [Thrips palmi]
MNVTRSIEKNFENAIRLFSTKKSVKEYNTSKLNHLCDQNGNIVPIACLPAQHHGLGANLGSEDDYSGLASELYLGVGTRVMLRTNLWLKKSLVNGSMGTVIDLLYEDGKSSPNDLPSVVMIKFDEYNGPGIGPENLVPIGRVTRYWNNKKKDEICSRNQFPLMVCYACTIHKSQGLTLDQAVIDIGPSEFSLGVSYVGISRVKTLDGILLNPFPLERLLNIKNRKEMNYRHGFEMILSMHKQ